MTSCMSMKANFRVNSFLNSCYYLLDITVPTTIIYQEFQICKVASNNLQSIWRTIVKLEKYVTSNLLVTVIAEFDINYLKDLHNRISEIVHTIRFNQIFKVLTFDLGGYLDDRYTNLKQFNVQNRRRRSGHDAIILTAH